MHPMKEEVKLIAEIRHLKRRRSILIIPMLGAMTLLFCAALNAEKKGERKMSLAFSGGAIATLICGSIYIRKLGNKETKIRRRLLEKQKEREWDI